MIKTAGQLVAGDVVIFPEAVIKTVKKVEVLRPTTDIVLIFWCEGTEQRECVNKQFSVRERKQNYQSMG